MDGYSWDFDNSTASAGAWLAFSGAANDDTFIGSAFDDAFAGTQGADTFDGGAGDFDAVTYFFEAGGVGIHADLSSDTITDTYGDTDTLINIEVIGGSDHDDVIDGRGTTADFTLIGEGGNDTMFGGAGNDTMFGGLGNDTLDGGAGTDTASYSWASGGVEVYLNANKSRGADGYDTLTNIENVTGSDFNDRLIGDVGNNILTGGYGDDILKGKGGDDSYYGEFGNDTIRGDAGVDTMFGGLGNDVLLGLAGNDTLEGGDGDDYLYGGQDNDTVNGGDGADGLRGNRGNDILNGGAGIDDLRGGGGNDTLDGGADGDYLYGENGIDTLYGGAGDDSLSGGLGGGIGDGYADTFIYKDTGAGGGGFDRVKDFENGIDVLDLSAFGFADFADVLAISSDSGSGLRVDFGSGDVFYIENFQLAGFDAGDVIL